MQPTTQEEWEGNWSPPWASHIEVKWTKRKAGPDGLPEPQKVICKCNHCGAEWQTMCSTGNVRTHGTRFGYVHFHKDAFNPEKKL